VGISGISVGFLTLGFALLFAFTPKGSDVIAEWPLVGLARWSWRSPSPAIATGRGLAASAAVVATRRLRKRRARRHNPMGQKREERA
jgi:hypothetical protein